MRNVWHRSYQKKTQGKLYQNKRSLATNKWNSGKGVLVELGAMPDKIPFYEKFGFDTNEAQRMKMMYQVK